MNAASALILGMFTVNGAPQGEVLDFTAKWCGPCRSVAPLVEKLKRQGYPIRKVDVEKHPELVKKYNVQTIPQFVLVINGKERTRVRGVQSESSLKRLLAQIPHAEDVEEVEEIVAQNDGPLRIGGIPIPFLGKSKTIEPEDVELLRAQNESTSETEPAVADPEQATVRLSVNNGGTIGKGTGTIIQSTANRSLAITCGHLFRHSNANTTIAVEVFENGQPTSYQARLVKFDDRSDVGLIEFAPQKIFPSIRIAADPKAVRPRDLVSSMGCGHGKDPSRWQMFVKTVDGYVGKSITECTQAPVDGRSGGGLFNRSGELIGICMAADKNANTGLYAGLIEIHSLLDQLSLTSLYRTTNADSKPFVATVAREISPEVQEETDRPAFANIISKNKSTLALDDVANVKVPVVVAPPVKLTEDEIGVIAASLQMCGPNGVRISIADADHIAGGHQVTIVNRVTRSNPMTNRIAPTKRRTDEAESLDWDNLLETQETQKPIASTVRDLPEWAREPARKSDAPPFSRNLH